MKLPKDMLCLKKMIKVLFNVVQEYYWPSMEQIYNQFAKDDRYELWIKIGKNHTRFFYLFLISQKRKIEKKFIKKGFKVTDKFSGFDIVFIGDTLKNPQKYGNAYLCYIDHGPSFKTHRYRNLLKQTNASYLIFVEGQYRIDKLKKYGLDKRHKIYNVGLSKHDPFFDGTFNRENILKKFNLDPKKKIVLYAPSYKPTSIFIIGKKLPSLLDEYNLIVKLHPYSWSGKYAPHSQHTLFEKMIKKYPNIHLVPKGEHNMMPYIFAADTLISEGSSVINEFLALERCGIIFNLENENLKHSDGQPILEEVNSDWLKGSFIHLSSAKELSGAIREALNPGEERKKQLKKDKEYLYSYTDGKSAYRLKKTIDRLLH